MFYPNVLFFSKRARSLFHSGLVSSREFSHIDSILSNYNMSHISVSPNGNYFFQSVAHFLGLVHTCGISVSTNIRMHSVNQSSISISMRKRKLLLFLMLMLMFMLRHFKYEPDNISISISISIMKQQYLMSAEIQAKIVPNPALISSFKIASSSNAGFL